jgi:HAE1 family hydrophobic/amphiphilic exporter-1/multidrug efflux pump
MTSSKLQLGSNEIFFAVISISVTLQYSVVQFFLEGFVGRLFRVLSSNRAAVLISAFVSLTLTPMLNAYLMKGGEQKKSKFYILTEPYFQKLNSNYASSLSSFMKRKWISFQLIALV